MGRVLVVGAQGRVGSQLTASLLAAGEAVVAGSRRLSGPAATSGAEAVRLDLTDPRTFGPALRGVDRAYFAPPLALGRPDEALAPWVAHCARAGVKLVLETAARPHAGEAGALAALERLVETSGCRYTVLRPTFLMDHFHGLWRDVLARRGQLPLPGEDRPVALIDAVDVADAAVVAMRETWAEGRLYTLAGPEALTFAQACARLGQAAGRPLAPAPGDEAGFAGAVAPASSGAAPCPVARALGGRLLALWADPVPAGADSREILGRSPAGLADYARRWAHAWDGR